MSTMDSFALNKNNRLCLGTVVGAAFMIVFFFFQ